MITPEKFEDERGFFARSWDKAIFEEKKLDSRLVQCSISFNKHKGTIRGIHYQDSPHEETKVVRCTKGSVFDVVLDLRKNSKTFKQWFGIKLDSNEYKQLYIPKGIAHGFQTLEDNTEIFYQIGEYHRPELYRGIRYDDPSFNIKWPLKITNVSKKDASFPDFEKV